MSGKAIDLTGMKFGRLTVIERRGSDKSGNAMWLCKCDCGNECVVRSNGLKRGNTKSCGCYNREKVREKTKERWQNEEYRQTQSKRMKEQMKKQWKNEEYRQIKSNKTKEQWQNEEFRQMKSNKTREQMKEMWKDEEMKWKLNYKGGITPISIYLRSLPIVSQWRKDTYIRENNRCQLTGKHVHGGNSSVHHLYGFNMIVVEAHTINGIEIKPQVKDYTEEELKLLEEYVASWHKDTSNAVLLCDEMHDLFHNIYGYGNNTKEQYIEFKERKQKEMVNNDL